ncbi:UvrD-helicase domain-containing protein [Anaerophaga thermohalophila]|jgi:hypothetical protein|uniref:UvrD-helicase domain-containing protein n=1 Tax=Anaerophaga thermohalophila TaxID=177400 RepID=UPI0002FD6667|nr:UvrD-helicase domain-containing protein [Anaerophaga thermohalophila]
MKPVTADEIKMAERILLSEGETFGGEGSERVKVIEELDKSCDVVACPGSGKTTVLLAKLLILANRMPFDDNRGICVLTHTNVAIDEIKKKAGIAGDKLFNYPNFFGTFQKFVDKFLAKPAYIKRFGTPFNSIGIDIVTKKVKTNYYREVRNDYSKDKWIFHQIKSKLPKTFPIGQKTKIINKEKFEYFNKIVFDFQEDMIFYKADITQNNYLAKNESTDRYKFIHSIKYPTLKEGYLYYDDAYSLGLWYISQNKKILKKTFSNRFKYVFVDEMQDTDSYQLKVIEDLFKNTDTIIQYFGDPNQSIYDFSVKEEIVWQPGKDGRKILRISDSKRFGNEISCVLDKLKVDGSLNLKSGSGNKTCKPHLLVFKQGEEYKVLEKFVEIIHDKQDKWIEELKNKNPVYKAIGWIAKERTKKEIDEGKLNISSYFPGFEKKAVKNKLAYDNLKFYLRKNEADKEKGAKIYYDSIINALLEVLDRGGVKRKVVINKQIEEEIQQITQERSYTKTSLFEILESKGKLKCLLNKISCWITQIYKSPEIYNSDVINDVRKDIKKYLPAIFNDFNENKVNEFLNEPPEASKSNYTEDAENKGYIFKSENQKYKDIAIEVGTVHSVKGETHTATLYMESYFDKSYESKRYIDILTNARKNHEKTLKMLHVGFSRPTHLLCFAVREDRINKAEIDSNEWHIIEV